MIYLFPSVTSFVVVAAFFIFCRGNWASLIGLSLFLTWFLYVFVPTLGKLASLSDYSLEYSVLALAAVCSMILGVLLGKVSPSIKSKVIKNLSLRSDILFLYSLVLLSIISLSGYVHSMGGWDSIANGIRLRYEGNENFVPGRLAVLLYFFPLIKIVGCVSFFRLVSKSDSCRGHYWIMFIVAFFLILCFSVVNASRGSVVLYVILLLFTYMNIISIQKKAVLQRYFVVAVMLLPFLYVSVVYGKKIISHTSKYLEGGSFDFTFERYEQRRKASLERFFKEFSHPYKSMDYLVGRDIRGNFFSHFIEAPLHLVPQSMFNGKKLKKISETNTEELTGDSRGSFPPGLFASFMYGGGYLLLIPVTFIYGYVLGFFQKNAEARNRRNSLLVPYNIYLSFAIPWFLFNGDPAIFLKSHVYLLLFCIGISLFALVSVFTDRGMGFREARS